MKRNIIFGIIFLLGLCIFLYPTVSNWLATRAHYSAVSSYDKKVKELQQKEIERRGKEANEHNKNVQTTSQSFSDPFNKKGSEESEHSYADILNVGESMGYIEIPTIDVKLPIYAGTSENVLSRGVGHIKASSLPVGGQSTHAILTGHRGLPSALLFTDLDQVKQGDTFYIHSLNKVLAYKVDQIKVVLPNEINDLLVVKDKDYVTLVTCTPYGVNTHRLLVRGERVPFELKEKEIINKSTSPLLGKQMIGVLIIVVIILILIYRRWRKNSKEVL
ncbi:class C sortase [Bacillus sp. MHSD_36]|uniref:class C sortase n=1 Tax=unclassified Bacillus (in: firmicutes) TaxID=185979 RepID=UPI002740B43B|nr:MULTISPECIES: class C sortase [unclassified Bacillus (in: firmicutes)]MDP7990608.1 class C sortase [Bacillus sp. MHSD_36]MDR4978616.1 class C sortase [Bacillus sp. MHSD_37]